MRLDKKEEHNVSLQRGMESNNASLLPLSIPNNDVEVVNDHLSDFESDEDIAEEQEIIQRFENLEQNLILMKEEFQDKISVLTREATIERAQVNAERDYFTVSFTHIDNRLQGLRKSVNVLEQQNDTLYEKLDVLIQKSSAYDRLTEELSQKTNELWDELEHLKETALAIKHSVESASTKPTVEVSTIDGGLHLQFK